MRPESHVQTPGDATTVRDRGSSSFVMVLLTPLFVLVALSGFQAAMWSHARTELRAVARDAAVQVARAGTDPGFIESEWVAALNREESLQHADIDIDFPAPVGQFVVVTITADAPGIFIGTSTKLLVREALPIEGFRS